MKTNPPPLTYNLQAQWLMPYWQLLICQENQSHLASINTQNRQMR